MANTTGKLDLERAEELEARYDPEMSFRPLAAIVRKLIAKVLAGDTAAAELKRIVGPH